MIFSVPIVLVGNKSDLFNERAIRTEEGRQLANNWKVAFLETSAKQNEVSIVIKFVTDCSINLVFDVSVCVLLVKLYKPVIYRTFTLSGITLLFRKSLEIQNWNIVNL